ncbi:MAG: energy transducer TonB [Parvularculales bacterium]
MKTETDISPLPPDGRYLWLLALLVAMVLHGGILWLLAAVITSPAGLSLSDKGAGQVIRLSVLSSPMPFLEEPVSEEEGEVSFELPPPEIPAPKNRPVAHAPAKETPPPPASEITATISPHSTFSTTNAQTQDQQKRDNYLAQVEMHLRKYLRYPRIARINGVEGTVVVRFTLNRHGELIKHQLIEKSGVALLDREALAMLKRASPMPPFPDELTVSFEDIIMPVVFAPKGE